MEAVQHIPIEDREAFKYALGATMVKNNAHWRAFETVFEVYFSLRGPEYKLVDGDDADLDEMWREMQEQMRQGEGKAPAAAAMDSLTPEEIAQLLMQALMNGDQAMMRALARQAVQRFAGMEPGRPVGGTYYLYRTLRNLDLDGDAREADGGQPRAGRRRADRRSRSASSRTSTSDRIEQFKKEIEAEIRRRLVADRGAEAMAKTLRKPLPEDVEFMHAVARRDAVAEEGAVPADPQARRPPGPQAPPRSQGSARLPQHGAPLAAATAACRPSRSSSTRARPSRS